MEVVKVRGDGDCLFHALGLMLHTKKEDREGTLKGIGGLRGWHV